MLEAATTNKADDIANALDLDLPIPENINDLKELFTQVIKDHDKNKKHQVKDSRGATKEKKTKSRTHQAVASAPSTKKSRPASRSNKRLTVQNTTASSSQKTRKSPRNQKRKNQDLVEEAGNDSRNGKRDRSKKKTRKQKS